jgi:uncharacterized Fe-S cluster protein YjdI
VSISDRASACAAIEMIVEQGEAPTSAHPDAHFWVFDRIRVEFEEAMKQAAGQGTRFEPVRPVVSNPMTRHYDDTAGGVVIAEPHTHLVAELFNAAYETLLLMLIRFFAHADETESELEHLSRATLRLMTTVIRPLGEALTKMPMGQSAPGKTAGPGFGYNRDIHLLPHKRSAWVFFGERLRDVALAATSLQAEHAGSLPDEVDEAAAALQALAEEFAPADRTPDGVFDYPGEAVTVHYNRLMCAASERCWRNLPEAFRYGKKPWIVPDGADTHRVVEVVRRCPSGALRYTFRGHLGPRHVHKPSIRIIQNGPYEVRGVHLNTSEWNAGASKMHYTLCRCGASKNKPFCDGSHWKAGFKDEKN